MKAFWIGLAAAVGAGVLWLLDFVMQVKREKTEVQIKENENEAEKIVNSKTAGELVDDFNKRYPSSGSAGNDSSGKKPKGSV